MSTTRPNDDDGATTIRTGPASGFHSDFATSSMYIGDTLPEGLRLGEYEILSVIGEGGFGIVYLAYDHFLQRQVALKEYMPSSLAGRSRMGLDVTIKSERHRDTFMAGLRSFINEARLLAQFDHRALVKVYRFWEGNGTAYMVMPYVVGPTLKAALADMGAPPDEAWLRSQVLTPLIEALSLLHKASCLHRDIAPDNILLTEAGPMLLDFGAARKVIGDLNQTLTVVLKPGYAPIEQYGEVPALTQGPWTDVYALGGVVRYAITGKVPVSATTRLVQDTMVPLAQLAQGQYGETFLQAVDTALAIKPADRPQDMLHFSTLLGEGPEAGSGVTGPVSLGGAATPLATAPVRTVWPATTGAGAGPATGPHTRPHTSPGAGHPTTAGQALLAQASSAQPGTVPSALESATTGRPVTTQAPVAKAPITEAPVTTPRPQAAPQTVAAPLSMAATPAAPSRSAWPWVLAVVALLALAALGAWFLFKPAPVSMPATAEPSTAPAASAAPLAPPPTPAAAEPAPASVDSQPQATTPASAEAAVPLPTAPLPQPATAPPVPTLAAKAPAPVATDRAVPAKPVATVPTANDKPPVDKPVSQTLPPARQAAGPDKSARCADLLQKASLEPLTPGETSFLRTECK
ncbi:MAG: protein kinase [Aquabacterium sp.]|uniref:serine/threonine protein kinase n=1 Tax=Aquabacterium sp. TaxID=1872578 RepID=UPI003BB07B2F